MAHPHPLIPDPSTSLTSSTPSTPLSLEDAAARVGHYRWIEMRLFEVMGAWVATVPELDVKPRLGTDCHHHAWHADLWQSRLPALQTLPRDRLTAPANDGVAAFMAALAEPQDPGLTIEKLVGVYRVLIPHKVAAYRSHLGRTSALSDGPTIRSLRLILADEMEDWRDGEILIQSLLDRPEAVRRAAEHQARLETLLVAAGGIAGPDPVGAAD